MSADNVENVGTSLGTQPDHAFAERVHKALSHDLRTPLGTIANYATILEYYDQAETEEVRVFGTRIRASAVRISSMLDELAEGWRLAASTPALTEVDPHGLLRELVANAGIRTKRAAEPSSPAVRCVASARLLAFAWRAFLKLQAEAAGHAVLEIGLSQDADPTANYVDLWVGDPTTGDGEPVRAAAFTHQPSPDAKPESVPSHDGCFALGIAEDLIRLHGGRFELWGRPGGAARLRVGFARTN